MEKEDIKMVVELAKFNIVLSSFTKNRIWFNCQNPDGGTAKNPYCSMDRTEVEELIKCLEEAKKEFLK